MITKRIRNLLAQYGWSVYRLGVESDISPSTLNSLLDASNNRIPNLLTLQRICDGFHISLKEFFSDDLFPQDSDAPFQQQLLREARGLSPSKQDHLLTYIKALKLL